jgi:hypothetical protein
VLFAVLTAAFVALAVASAWGAGGEVRRWLVAAAAAALAFWTGDLARRILRRT